MGWRRPLGPGQGPARKGTSATKLQLEGVCVPPHHTHTHWLLGVEVAWPFWDRASFSSDPRLGGGHVQGEDRQGWVIVSDRNLATGWTLRTGSQGRCRTEGPRSVLLPALGIVVPARPPSFSV